MEPDLESIDRYVDIAVKGQAPDLQNSPWSMRGGSAG